MKRKAKNNFFPLKSLQERESRLKRLASSVSATGQDCRVRNDKMCKVISETGHYLQGITSVPIKGWDRRKNYDN
jgi:hypothetical protein